MSRAQLLACSLLFLYGTALSHSHLSAVFCQHPHALHFQHTNHAIEQQHVIRVLLNTPYITQATQQQQQRHRSSHEKTYSVLQQSSHSINATPELLLDTALLTTDPATTDSAVSLLYSIHMAGRYDTASRSITLVRCRVHSTT